MVHGKHVRSEVAASNSGIGNLLDERPPIGVEQHSVLQPVADELLASGRPSGLTQTSSEGGRVSTRNLDRAPQSNNVTFLHEHAKYTNRFVSATTPFVRQDHKGVCTVLDMTTARHAKPIRRPTRAPKPRREKRVALPGPDGRKLGDRVLEAMAYKTGRLGETYRPADLLRDVARISPPGETILSQQMLSAILRNTVTKTSKTPLIAQACGVNAIWMAHGIGKMIE